MPGWTLGYETGPDSTGFGPAQLGYLGPEARAAPSLPAGGAHRPRLRRGHRPGFNFGSTLIKPLSRGRVTLGSADPLAPARIEPNYLSERQDVDLLVEGVKVSRRLAHAQAFEKLLGREVLPGPEAQTDADLEAFVRRTAETIYHPTSTCAMGPDPATSVVDPQLRVRGL